MSSRSDVLNRDALAAKYRTLRDWRDTNRSESLSVWETDRLEDGSLIVSSQVRGPDPARALRVFVARQTSALSDRGRLDSGWEVPLLDVDVPGRISCVWQQDGVWVRLWYVDTPARPEPVRRRWFPGGRFPFTRNRKKETTRA